MRRLLLALAVTVAATTSTACNDRPILADVEHPDRGGGRGLWSWLTGPAAPKLAEPQQPDQVVATRDDFGWTRAMPWLGAVPLILSAPDSPTRTN